MKLRNNLSLASFLPRARWTMRICWPFFFRFDSRVAQLFCSVLKMDNRNVLLFEIMQRSEYVGVCVWAITFINPYFGSIRASVWTMPFLGGLWILEHLMTKCFVFIHRWESRYQHSSHWTRRHQTTTNSIQWRSNLPKCESFFKFIKTVLWTQISKTRFGHQNGVSKMNRSKSSNNSRQT